MSSMALVDHRRFRLGMPRPSERPVMAVALGCTWIFARHKRKGSSLLAPAPAAKTIRFSGRPLVSHDELGVSSVLPHTM